MQATVKVDIIWS